MQFLKNSWEELDAAKKRNAIVMLSVVGIILIVYIVSPKEESETNEPKPNEIQNILTDSSTRSVGLEAISVRVDQLKGRNRDLERQLEKLAAHQKQQDELVRESREVNNEIKRLKREMRQLRSEGISSSPKSGDPQMGLSDNTSSDGTFSYQKQQNQYGYSDETEETPFQIVSHTAPVVESDEEGGEEEVSHFIPAGSILTGVFINGLDAPTSKGARQDPFPVLLRVQKEAILPNQFRADIRECFLIASGYGDLSSERAYLRGETISCVREDGKAIENSINAYVVGEDGKAGVRGRLVTKQGQMIARSFVAGGLSGLSEAFDVDPVPAINVTPGSTQGYQSVYNSEALQGAAAKGAAKSLDRIAEFYLEMAELIFPIIEVDAGRRVDVILNKGLKLKVVANTTTGINQNKDL